MRWLIILLLALMVSESSLAKVVHEYPTQLEGVVDADTMDVIFDQGLGSFFKARVRIKDFDAPETWRPCNDAEEAHGEEATAFAVELLPEHFTVISYGWAVYNRVEVTILLPDGRIFSDVMRANGFAKKESYDPNDDSC